MPLSGLHTPWRARQSTTFGSGACHGSGNSGGTLSEEPTLALLREALARAREESAVLERASQGLQKRMLGLRASLDGVLEGLDASD